MIQRPLIDRQAGRARPYRHRPITTRRPRLRPPLAPAGASAGLPSALAGAAARALAALAAHSRGNLVPRRRKPLSPCPAHAHPAHVLPLTLVTSAPLVLTEAEH